MINTDDFIKDFFTAYKDFLDESEDIGEDYVPEKTSKDIVHNLRIRHDDEIVIEVVDNLNYKIKWCDEWYKFQMPSFLTCFKYIESMDGTDLTKKLLTEHIFRGDGSRITLEEWDKKIDRVLATDLLYFMKRLLCIS